MLKQSFVKRMQEAFYILYTKNNKEIIKEELCMEKEYILNYSQVSRHKKAQFF